VPPVSDGGTDNVLSGTTGAAVQAGSITGDVHLTVSQQVSSLPAPHELPSAVFGFTDRTSQLAALDRLLAVATKSPAAGSAVIFAVSGTAGVGKTAFATHWGHRARDHFPDGQLYVNLRGYGPDRPVDAGEALTGFLRAMGVPNVEIPYSVDERAARFRTLVAGRQILIVLDNARTAEQVRPLLPGSPSCVVLVTSRDTLPGLVARDGARRISLDLLPADKAISLLRKLIGKRVDTDRAAAHALAEQCARLPLALRIAAERAIANPDTPLAELVADLADEPHRLDLLDSGDDPYTAVRVVFSWSYGYLEPAAARLFRMIGLHPGRDFDVHIVAALADLDPAAARQQLAALVRAHLVEHGEGSRYQLHDLLRVYAAELVTQEEPESVAHAALSRLFDYLVRTAAQAMDLVTPHERDRRPVLDERRGTVAFRGPEDAASWLATERANLLAAAAHGVGHGWFNHTNTLSAILYRYLDNHAYYDDAVALHTYAVTATHRLDDQAAHSQALHNLGSAYQRLGRYQEALEFLTQSLDVAQRVNHRPTEGYALKDLGMVYWLLGRTTEALDALDRALAIVRETNNRIGQGQVFNTIALVYGRVGRHEEAIDHISEALTIFRETGDRPRQGWALHDLGTAHWRLGNHAEALHHQRQALALSGETGERSLAAASLNGIGNITRVTGDPAGAIEFHRRALRIADEVGDRHEQAQANNGLGHAHQALGDAASARQHWEQALAIFTNMGAPEADEVRARLA
jgi:tetratricopeptide (TPR) repeat protein